MNDPHVYLIRGNQFYQQDDFESAIERYDRCITAIGKAAVREPYYLRGNAKVANGDYEGAIEDYNSALEGTIAKLESYRLLKEKNITIPDDGSDRWRILFNRGNAQAELGRYEEALQDYNKAVRCAPKSDRWRILFNRGNANAALKKYEDALQDYDKAVQHVRNTPYELLTGMIVFNQANAKTILERYEDAIRDYEEAIHLETEGSPVKKVARFNKGNVLAMTGRFRDARQCYDESVRKGDSSRVASNRKALQGILKSIGEAEHTSNTRRDADGEVCVIVTVNDGSKEDSRVPRPFGFEGNVGNIGNYGGPRRLPGGNGYQGGPAFIVHVCTGNPPPSPGPPAP